MASDDNNIRVVNLSDLKKVVGGSDDIEEMLKNLGDSSGSTRYYENPSTPVTCSKCSSSNLSFQGIESLKCKFKCLNCGEVFLFNS